MVKRSKRLNNKHLETYQMVRQLEGPRFGKGSVNFWMRFKDEWNKKHPENQYGNWKSPQKAFSSIVEKMEGPNPSSSQMKTENG